jgi:hypothetical protein
MPMWSGCMCVTNTRVTGSPSSGPFSTARHALRVSVPPMPVSTMAQPSPSRIAHTLIADSAPPRGMRIHFTPGAMSSASPVLGACSKG